MRYMDYILPVLMYLAFFELIEKETYLPFSTLISHSEAVYLSCERDVMTRMAVWIN